MKNFLALIQYLKSNFSLMTKKNYGLKNILKSINGKRKQQTYFLEREVFWLYPVSSLHQQIAEQEEVCFFLQTKL